MNEELLFGLILVGIGLAAVGLISFILSFFLALRSPPSKRAGWTAGVAYFVATVVFISSTARDEWIVPLVTLPGGLIAFWYWRMVFRHAWTDTPEDLPNGKRIEDDDWRAGLFGFLAIAALLLGLALVRRLIRGH